MKSLKLLIVSIVLLSCVPAEAGFFRHKQKVRRYKVVTSDGGTSVVLGTELRTKGFFVEIWLNGILDTVVTAPKYVTELPPEEVPTAAPAREESPIEQKNKVARVLNRH